MHYSKWQSLSLLSLAAIALLANPAISLAQSITLDGTLGSTAPIPTLANPAFATIYDIQQNLGQTVGSNLFHSFSRFNLTASEAASFRSDVSIRNILARVTGGTASSIDGLIYTESRNVNLFLINPAGIVFGPNAQLNVGSSTRGSFVATTVDAITFPGGGQFSAVNPGNASSLLTLVGDPSGFLASQRQPGAIASTSNFLYVYPNQSLLLLGGEIQLNGSLLQAENGRVELAGVAGAGTVGLTTTGNTLTLDISAQTARSDISLSNGAFLFVLDQGAGSIAIAARNLDIGGGSIVLAGIAPGQTASSDRPGAITLDATDLITIRQGSTLGNSVFGGVGNGGDLQIQTGSLQVTDGSFLANFHTGIGKSGNLLITARNSVTFDGGEASTSAVRGQGDAGDIRITANQLNFLNGGKLQTTTNRSGNAGQILLDIQDATVLHGTARNPMLTSGIFSFVGSGGVGRGGNIQLTTGSLSVTNGAQIQASTFGQGDGGDIAITARDTIRVDGAAKNPFGIGTSGITSKVSGIGIGNGGTIRLATRDLTVTNGAEIDVSTLGRGNTGNILIDVSNSITVDGEAPEQLITATGQLLSIRSGIGAIVSSDAGGNGGIVQLQTRTLALTNGGTISTVSAGQGNAAEINILAHDSIRISGIAKDGERSGIVSAVNQGEGFNGELFQGSGRSGNIRLVTGDLFLDQQGLILASAISQTGSAGDITIQANTIQLDHGSKINTTSAASNGGNITLNVRDFVLLRRNSSISATAGTAQSGGDGGNIAINAPNGFVVGVKAENSDITANAFTGSGGRVNITARGIYGLQFRPQLTAFSDITASSEFGISGTVTLNTPDVDPSRGLAQLIGTLIDPTQQIDQRCSPKGSQRSNSFVSTGRGGLPSTPFEPLQNEDTPAEWVVVEPKGERLSENRGQSSSPPRSAASPAPIIEAQGWVQQPDGSIDLVAQAQTNQPHSFWLGLPECPSMLQRE